MAKKMIKLISVLMVLLIASTVAFAQGFVEPRDITTREEKVDNFVNAVKRGDTVAFRLVTYDILAGKDIGGDSRACGGTKTANVIDTIRCAALENDVSFMEYFTDGDTSDDSETRKNLITATLQGLYNLDPRIRLIAIEWLRRLRPDAMMFRDVERAVEYETVASSYEKYRPKNIDIPSIDEPGSPGVNVEFDYYYTVPEETIRYPFADIDGNIGSKVNYRDPETGKIVSLTDPRPTATQLDARKWGQANPFDPTVRQLEIDTYINVMTQAGALRRFRNERDAHLLGYQYRLGSYYQGNYNGTDPKNLTADQRLEIQHSMVPIGHGDKYYYRNINGSDVIGNSWAELIKLREFIVRAIWTHRIRQLDLNSLVIISKDSFATLYLSIDGERAANVPFLSVSTNTPIIDERHVPVLIQGLLKNPIYSTKWVIARALKDIYLMEGVELETKTRINVALRQAKYDALAKDVIKGAILHEELITVGKINLATNYGKVPSEEYTYTSYKLDEKGELILDENGVPISTNVKVGRFPSGESANYAGGIYIPSREEREVEEEVTVSPDGFAIPNDEVVARGNKRLTSLLDKDAVNDNRYNDDLDFNWFESNTDLANLNQVDFYDRVLDSFAFYNKIYVNGVVYRTADPVTYYSDRTRYELAKATYHRYNYELPGGNPRVDDAGLPTPELRNVKPLFNVGHYNKVVSFINSVVAGNNEEMATVTWDVVESAQLLVMLRLKAMLEAENRHTGVYDPDAILLNRDTRVVFFDAFQEMPQAEENFRMIDDVENREAQTDYAGRYTFDNFKGTFTVAGFTKEFTNTLNISLLKDVVARVDLFRESDGNYNVRPVKDYDSTRRSAFVSASLPGLFNKDPRIRLTAIHWLRRLGPSDEMFDLVRRARGIYQQEEVRTDISDDPYRTDRSETGLNRHEFLDTNVYHRNDNPSLDNDYVAEVFGTSGINKVYASGGKGLVGVFGHDFGKEIAHNNKIRSILYLISQDFQTFVYEPLKLSELSQTVTFYDMKPNYAPALPNEDPGFPNVRVDNFDAIDDLVQLRAVANPLYTEDKYEFYFGSYGLYQLKEPSEELEKLYRLILRQRLVNRIKSGRELDIFMTLPRFDFSVLALRLDAEYILRIPMQSFFGLVGKDKFFDVHPNQGGINVVNGDYNADTSFLLPTGGTISRSPSYQKYPIFRAAQVGVIKLGVDNPNFIVQKGTAEFLIRFYNFYCNDIGGGPEATFNTARRDIRDAMYYYKQADIVIEEVTLAFEAENPEGRAVVKTGTRLGNELNPGGVRQYKNLPAELRKDIRRTLNREVQNFEREIAGILGVRRQSAVYEGDPLGYVTDEDDYIQVKPAD